MLGARVTEINYTNRMALTMFKKKSKKDSKAAKNTKTKEEDLPQLSPPPEQWRDLPDMEEEPAKPVSKQGKKIVDSANQGMFHPSDVYDAGYEELRTTTVPTARDAAFDGPPRYDWVDVESAAAIKVQSIYRRNQVWSELEKEGKSTAAMRNRARSRQARQNGSQMMAGEDVPFAMRFCGIGMLFGDATGEDNDALNSQRDVAAMKRQEKEKKEASRRKFRMRKKSSDQLEEAIEVVDNVALEGEKEEETQTQEPEGDVKKTGKKNKFRLFGKNK